MKLLLLSGLLATAAHDPWVLFPEGMVPGERPGTIGPESESRCSWGVAELCIDNVTVPTLIPYLANGSTSAMVIAPGGGYTSLSWNNEGLDVAEWLVSIGISAFVLKYRVPERPWLNEGMPGACGGAPFMDGQRAMRLVRSRAPSFGLNISRIGFMGFSAGGHLTAHVSNYFHVDAYPKIDSIDDISSRPDFTLFGYPWVLEDDNQTLQFKVGKDHPPAFIVQAEDDSNTDVANSLLYFLALKRAHAPPSELHEYPHGDHGFGMCKYKQERAKLEVCSWPERALTFLRNIGVTNVKLEQRFV